MFLIIYNDPLRKHVKSFGMPYAIMVGLSGNGLLGTWKRPRMWPTRTSLRPSIWIGRVECLIVTMSNLVVTWKVRPHMDIISWFQLRWHWFAHVGCIWFHSCNWILNLWYIFLKKNFGGKRNSKLIWWRNKINFVNLLKGFTMPLVNRRCLVDDQWEECCLFMPWLCSRRYST